MYLNLGSRPPRSSQSVPSSSSGHSQVSLSPSQFSLSHFFLSEPLIKTSLVYIVWHNARIWYLRAPIVRDALEEGAIFCLCRTRSSSGRWLNHRGRIIERTNFTMDCWSVRPYRVYYALCQTIDLYASQCNEVLLRQLCRWLGYTSNWRGKRNIPSSIENVNLTCTAASP